MAKEYRVGERYYLPVRVREIMDDTYTYPVRIEFENGNGCMDGMNAIKGNPDLLLNAEEVAGPLKTKADAMTVTADSLQKENEELKAKIAELTAWYEEANKTASEAAEANDELKTQIAELKAERDKFAKTAKDKADLANKACDERNDVQGDLETAKAIVNHLQEENKDLKQKLEDADACYTVVADTSIKRKNRVTTMEEVIVALVEKIRRLEGGE